MENKTIQDSLTSFRMEINDHFKHLNSMSVAIREIEKTVQMAGVKMHFEYDLPDNNEYSNVRFLWAKNPTIKRYSRYRLILSMDEKEIPFVESSVDQKIMYSGYLIKFLDALKVHVIKTTNEMMVQKA